MRRLCDTARAFWRNNKPDSQNGKNPKQNEKKTKNNPRDFLIEIRGELVRKFQREIFVDLIHK
jgi:hypothetical protein